MRLKYHVLYFFEFVDEGLRFELRKLRKWRQRLGDVLPLSDDPRQLLA